MQRKELKTDAVDLIQMLYGVENCFTSSVPWQQKNNIRGEKVFLFAVTTKQQHIVRDVYPHLCNFLVSLLVLYCCTRKCMLMMTVEMNDKVMQEWSNFVDCKKEMNISQNCMQHSKKSLFCHINSQEFFFPSS